MIRFVSFAFVVARVQFFRVDSDAVVCASVEREAGK